MLPLFNHSIRFIVAVAVMFIVLERTQETYFPSFAGLEERISHLTVHADA